MPTQIAHTLLRSNLGYGGDFLRVQGTAVEADHYFKIRVRDMKTRLKHLICTLVSGTAVTVQPRVHNAPAATIDAAGTIQAKVAAAAASANETQEVSIWTHAGFLYIWPGVDAGTNNVVDLEVHLAYGLE
jgi:hypothetical protein